MSLKGKVVVIAGASRGIGRDMAVVLAEAGADLVVGARSETQPDPRLPGTIYTVAKEVEERGSRALPLKLDVTKDEDVENMVAKTMETFGRMDAFIYNPSVLIPGNTRTVQPRHLDLLWRLNMKAPILMVRSVIDPIKQGGGGHIILISSRGGVFIGPGPYTEEQQARGRAGGAFYGMTKAGLERYSQSLAAELQSDNIAVNVLSPQGRIRTPGNVFTENDKDNPNLEFEEAVAMGKAARYILEQDPQQFTGNILFDEDMMAKYNL